MKNYRPADTRCDAIVEDFSGATYSGLRRPVRVSVPKRCSRRYVGVVYGDVSELYLCKQHMALAVEGLVDIGGAVMPAEDRRVTRKYHKPKHRWVEGWLSFCSDFSKDAATR